MRAHRESDVELLLEDEGADYVVANRGEITRPTLQQRRERLGPYLRATRFSEYRDLVEPVVGVSDDATSGWVVVQVFARGRQASAGGEELPIEFTSAWIELYEKRGGKWLRTGNVSNFKPPPAGPEHAGRWVGDARLFDRTLRAKAAPLEAELRIEPDHALSGRIGAARIPRTAPTSVAPGRIEYRIVLEGRVKDVEGLDQTHLVVLVTPRPGGALDADFHLKSRFGFDAAMRVGHFDVKRVD